MILGSHNSMTYLSPQWYLRPLFWMGRCQSLHIKEQFDAGARWFDLRIAFDDMGLPYFAHGIFSYKGVNVGDVLETLDTLSSDTEDKVYVRLLNERDSERSKVFFYNLCFDLKGRYPNLIFTGGQNKKDWSLIYDFRTYPDKPLVDKYSSCNHDHCVYDESGKEVEHVNNTGSFWDDLFPWLYAKKNNSKNRLKYLMDDVYLLQDFIGKW